MLIRVAPNFTATLEAADDLKAFKMVVDGPKPELRKLAEALSDVALFSGESHAWVYARWLRQVSTLADDPQWQQGFAKMTDFARRQGWVNDTLGLIRAHIEWGAR